MKTIEDMMDMLAYKRLEEIPEEKKSDRRLAEFCGLIEGEKKRELMEILDEAVFERDRREKEIYLRGLKDGMRLSEIIRRC